MPSVDDTALEEDIVPGRKWLMLHSYWESWYGGLANITISVVERLPDGSYAEDIELFSEDVEEWADGEFANQDVVKRYAARFAALLKKERQKVPQLKKWPTRGKATFYAPRGRGWHGERERHRQAALKGKLPRKFASVRDAETAIDERISKGLGLPAPRSMRWIGQSAVMDAAKKIGKKKDMGVSFK